MPTYRSSSSEETKQLGRAIAEALQRRSLGKHARVVALSGDLGAGKTTFVQGFFKGLRVHEEAASPTFIIIRRTALKKSIFTDVFHVDAYRLKSAEDLLKLEFREILRNPKHLVLVEWPEKIAEFLPPDTLWLDFTHGEVPAERTIKTPDIIEERPRARSKVAAKKKR